MKILFRSLLLLFNVTFIISSVHAKTVTMSKEVLQDKIKGGWAGQVIGCSFGGPTEFRYQSTFIQDYQPLEWNEKIIKWWYDNVPGLYDDVYMDLTFVQVFAEKGIDAPASEFAYAFAKAEYKLWHANIAARYNILNGIMPPQSGHWLHNPHSDDIDFQIEADFSGLMSPGMVNTSAEISDRIGHIMNYGDGWYGGVYVGAMYALAFVSDDVNYIVSEALKVIPKESRFYQCMTDVINWHKEYPEDWKIAWFKTQQKWGEDIGCPYGVFTTFNIDAKINAAWILLGLLYGESDYAKTLSISTRAGDDSDCNPASAGGILGTMLGYSRIPDFWKQGLDKVEDIDFKYTTMSLNDTYDMSYRQALQVIERNGGRVDDKEVTISVQQPRAVKLEVGFEGHYPVKRTGLDTKFSTETSFEFEGIGFVTTGSIQKLGDEDETYNVEMFIDGQLVETSKLPTNYTIRKDPLFWRYQLPIGKHAVRLKVLNPSHKAVIQLDDIVIYSNKPANPKF
ncbi:ADP-ribosylglycohydrolase family protein [candidate division KSB1 bacterium]|nr:ADP-ribosylglycohydrolase family protein [candidate division KSB1 bacterium]